MAMTSSLVTRQFMALTAEAEAPSGRANLMSIVILSRGTCGLTKGITRYMVTMAIADLMVCVFNITINNILTSHFLDSFLMYTNVCRFSAFIQVFSVQLSVCSTVSFTFDRYVSICCPKLKLNYCTHRTATVVLTIVGVLSFLINIPVYFRYEPYYLVGDIEWGCRTVTEYGSSPAWIAYKWILNLSVTLVPFPFLLLLNSLTARYILIASRARRALKKCSNGDSSSDPEMKNRRTSIILLFSVSGSFIVLWTPVLMIDICFKLTETITWEGPNSLYLAIKITVFLMYTSTCTNTCVYALTQRKFREEIKNIVKYPFSFIIKLCKQYEYSQSIRVHCPLARSLDHLGISSGSTFIQELEYINRRVIRIAK
uniref:probable G-protein coupled receptor 139 n=1 Tax=Pristiophorus japonicus TaxID=55135 RepID=UPI00398F5906